MKFFLNKKQLESFFNEELKTVYLLNFFHTKSVNATVWKVDRKTYLWYDLKKYIN